MRGSVFLMSSLVVVSLAVVLISVYLSLFYEGAKLPEEEVKELAREYFFASSASSSPDEEKIISEDLYMIDQPLVGRVAVVTGATSGIGASLAMSLYRMGATVIVTSRNQEKSDKTVSNMKLDFPFSEGKLYAQTLDVSDFESISKFSAWMNQNFQELHFLLNNAGINYVTQALKPTASQPLKSAQGYDLLFASNYLGHFLLTEQLLPLLQSTPKAKILQVSSTSHYAAPAENLITDNGKNLPVAAQVLVAEPESGGVSVAQRAAWHSAYGLSKLAQVMHAIELQRELSDRNDTDLKIFSYAPGITYTGMVPDVLPDALKELFSRLFYSPDAAVYAALKGLLSKEMTGGDEFWSNSPIFIEHTALGRWLKSLAQRGSPKVRTTARGAIIFLSALYQRINYGDVTITPVNPVCADTELTGGLFRWSRAEVQRYLKMSE